MTLNAQAVSLATAIVNKGKQQCVIYNMVPDYIILSRVNMATVSSQIFVLW